MTTPTPTIYQSRSRATRKRILVIAAVLALVLVGVLIGRLASGSPAAGSSATAAPPSSAAASPDASPDASSDAPSATPSSAPPAAPTGVDAYQPIQAENAAALSGIDKQDTQDAGGGQNVGWIANGDSMRFDTINFGATPATQFIARVASDVGDGVNGRVEVRIDDQGSPPVGTLPVQNTGGWQNWITQGTDITGVTGVHTVFLTFAADGGDDFLNLNYVRFDH